MESRVPDRLHLSKLVLSRGKTSGAKMKDLNLAVKPVPGEIRIIFFSATDNVNRFIE